MTLGVAGVASATGTVSISGTDQIPNTLTATITSGSGTPTYQWLSCPASVAQSSLPTGCTNVGTNSSSYQLAASDYNNYISVQVTDTSGTGGASATYYATLVGPIHEPAPVASPNSNFTISLSPSNTYVGSVATAPSVSNGFTIDNQTGATQYAWYDCSGTSSPSTSLSGCSSISGAAGSTYTLSTNDFGKYLVVAETVSNAVGSATAYSASTTSTVSGAALTPGSPPPAVTQGTFSATATPGTWSGNPTASSYTISWYRCSQAVTTAATSLDSHCTLISGSASTSLSGPWSYTYTASDVSTYLLAGVQANNGFTSNTVWYSASTTSAIQAVAPAITSYPALSGLTSGSAIVGTSIVVSSGSWSALPTPSISYQWYSCTSNPLWNGGGQASTVPTLSSSCSTVGGAATSSFPVASTYSADYLIAAVKASNSAGSYYYLPAAVSVTAGTPSSAGSVVISANVNGVYTASVGSTAFNGTPAPTIAFDWYRCTSSQSAITTTVASNPLSACTHLTSSSPTTYAPTSSDVTNPVSYLVALATATSLGLTTEYVNSDSVTLTSGAPSFSALTMTGAGATSTLLSTALTANPTFTAIPAPTSTAYAWMVCTTAQTSAGPTLTATASGCSTVQTSSTYADNTLGDAGANLLVEVTESNGIGTTSYYSASTVLASAVPTNAVVPSLSSTTASTAAALGANNGTWLGAPTPTLSDAWFYCTSSVSAPSTSLANTCHATGSTGASFLPTASYVNDYFLVGVTGHNGVGGGTTSDLTVYSASTTTALVSTLAITSLTISGTATVGSTLTAVPVVTSQGTYASAYQWYECTLSVPAGTSAPANCYLIAGATSATFVPTSNQANYYLTVFETVSGAGTTASALAASTGLVTTSVPGSPTSATAVAGVGQVTVSWIAPKTGLAVTKYVVTASNGSSCTATTTSCVVTGLLYGTSYTFTVKASNSYGTSPASTPSNAVMPSESYPAAPTVVNAVPGNQSATVSWTAAVNNGAVVTAYVVTAYPGGMTCTTSLTTCVVSGLTNGTPYTFTVVARNVVGTGPASFATTPVVPKVAAAPAPINVVVRRGNGTLIVHWSAGLANGAVVTDYVVSATGGGVTRTCTTTGTSCVVRGLTNGVAYHVSVVARSTSGSAATAIPTAIAPAGRPSPPVIFHSFGGAGVIIVHFRVPTQTGGAPIAYYQYFINGRWTVQTLKGKPFVVVRGLLRHHAYIVRVRAVSIGGPSPASMWVRVITQ